MEQVQQVASPTYVQTHNTVNNVVGGTAVGCRKQRKTEMKTD